MNDLLTTQKQAVLDFPLRPVFEGDSAGKGVHHPKCEPPLIGDAGAKGISRAPSTKYKVSSKLSSFGLSLRDPAITGSERPLPAKGGFRDRAGRKGSQFLETSHVLYVTSHAWLADLQENL